MSCHVIKYILTSSEEVRVIISATIISACTDLVGMQSFVQGLCGECLQWVEEFFQRGQV